MAAKRLVVTFEHILLVNHLLGGFELFKKIANVPEFDGPGNVLAHFANKSQILKPKTISSEAYFDF